MADVFSKEQRSQIMRQVKRNFNKSTELRLIQFFKIHLISGWRRNYKIYGKPDFVFPKRRLAVFVDGCFWHGHNCRNTKPQDNKNYWENKIKKNIERDISVSNILESKGWKVLRIWECQLKDSESLINHFHV
jgi:DNA mismatch endonuclease, patch repair protein